MWRLLSFRLFSMVRPLTDRSDKREKLVNDKLRNQQHYILIMNSMLY